MWLIIQNREVSGCTAFCAIVNNDILNFLSGMKQVWWFDELRGSMRTLLAQRSWLLSTALLCSSQVLDVLDWHRRCWIRPLLFWNEIQNVSDNTLRRHLSIACHCCLLLIISFKKTIELVRTVSQKLDQTDSVIFVASTEQVSTWSDSDESVSYTHLTLPTILRV